MRHLKRELGLGTASRASRSYCVITLLSAAILAGPAFAQTASPEPQENSGEVSEIIVTAQKRSENLQDVPISIATLSGQGLDALFNSGDDILALSSRVPSLNVESSNGRVAPRFYIRGLGNTDFDLAASQPVSVIVDDVVLENVVLKSSPLFDLAQVEVLRGPQGTLFGRNTPAGIVKFDTARPTQNFEAKAAATFGSFNTVTGEGAVSGPLAKDVLAIRISALAQHRDDYIDNSFTDQIGALGGYDEFAGRVQLLYTPGQRFSALLNLHARTIDGTSAVFRANIIGPGSNRINENFDRRVVEFDGGDNNRQQYDGYGGSLKWDFDFGPLVFTSITALETTNGSSRGDIDGGSGAVFLPGGSSPGPIPFPSDTVDGIDELDQTTQEIRFSSDHGGPINWQFGFYYFNSNLQITTNPFFAPPTTVLQENQSYAVFGQVGYQVTEKLKVTGGLRYTDDDKQFRALAANLPTPDVVASDDRLSWDVTTAWQLTDDINVYGRIARGFRAPTIQGRDVAFFGAPSVATSETVLSFEGGIKSTLFANRVRLNTSGFYYRIRDQQLSAIGGVNNLTQLVNADLGIGFGFELDSEWVVNDYLTLTSGVSYNNTELKDDTLAVAPCGSGLCTVLDPLNASGQALVSGNPFPQAPKAIISATGRFAYPVSSKGELFLFTDWFFQTNANFFLYESAEFRSGGTFEGGLQIGYASLDGNLEFALFARNITNQVNLKGGIDFNNLTGFVNEPRVFGVSVKGRFR